MQGRGAKDEEGKVEEEETMREKGGGKMGRCQKMMKKRGNRCKEKGQR